MRVPSGNPRRDSDRRAGYCRNWGTGPVGFLAMLLARFRGHACAGGRLRVWPRTKLNKKRAKPKGFAGKKGKPMKKTVKKKLAKKRGTPKKRSEEHTSELQ